MHGSDLPRNPSSRSLRQFAGLWLVVFSILAGGQCARGRPVPAAALAALALGIGLLGLFRPRIVRPIFVGWMILAFPFGWISSRFFLACLFYGVFTPLGLCFRLAGRDMLARRGHRGQATYWQAKPAVTDRRRYYRQF